MWMWTLNRVDRNRIEMFSHPVNLNGTLFNGRLDIIRCTYLWFVEILCSVHWNCSGNLPTLVDAQSSNFRNVYIMHTVYSESTIKKDKLWTFVSKRKPTAEFPCLQSKQSHRFKVINNIKSTIILQCARHEKCVVVQRLQTTEWWA